MRITVIVATYNRPDYLRTVLNALQDQRDFGSAEVIVADDGSDDRTRAVVAESLGPLTVKHIRHADEGFRLAAIRNRAAAAATGDYLVFLDDDCIARPTFITRHRAFAQEGFIVAGERVSLNKRLSDEIILRGLQVQHWGWKWFRTRLRGEVDRIGRLLICLPDGPHRKLQVANWQAVEGCNFGIFRSDYLTVNGFDETFSGWGYEDWDFAQRLGCAGVVVKDGRFALAVAHLWHRLHDRSEADANLKMLRDRQERRVVKADLGIDQYLRQAC